MAAVYRMLARLADRGVETLMEAVTFGLLLGAAKVHGVRLGTHLRDLAKEASVRYALLLKIRKAAVAETGDSSGRELPMTRDVRFRPKRSLMKCRIDPSSIICWLERTVPRSLKHVLSKFVLCHPVGCVGRHRERPPAHRQRFDNASPVANGLCGRFHKHAKLRACHIRLSAMQEAAYEAHFHKTFQALPDIHKPFCWSLPKRAVSARI